MGKLKVLHLLGSSDSTYYADLSCLWARGSVNALENRVSDSIDFVFAFVHPNPQRNDPFDCDWSFPPNLDAATLTSSPTLVFGAAKQRLLSMRVDACVTHMYDEEGTTYYRELLDSLGISFIGSTVSTMRISNNKQSARRCVSANGVAVPKGLSLSKAEYERLDFLRFPVMVKPCVQDNSFGISFVQGNDEMDRALRGAFEFDDEVLIEEFIALGRELRVGVVEDAQGELVVLPCIEYYLSDAHPWRGNADKFSEGAKSHAKAAMKIDCDVDAVLRAKLETMGKRAHRALGARDFSLYDVRVDPDGEPYFIESNLYCSFSSKSIIVLMAQAMRDERFSHARLFETFVRRAAKRTQKMRALRAKL